MAATSDDELLEFARSGRDVQAAFAELYRRHCRGAQSLARRLLRDRHDADDVVHEAFANVILAVGRGSGPATNFKTYLLTCVRNTCRSRKYARPTTAAESAGIEVSAIAPAADGVAESSVAATAFATLSADWQEALWLTAVEGRPVREVARQLGRHPNAVAALTYRARQAFAEAYLDQHRERVRDRECRHVADKLARYVRETASAADVEYVEQHLQRCSVCSTAVAELRDVNGSLRSLAGAAIGAGTVGTVVATQSALGSVGSVGWSVPIFGGAMLKVAAFGAVLLPMACLVTESSNSGSGSGVHASAVLRPPEGSSGSAVTGASASFVAAGDDRAADASADVAAGPRASVGDVGETATAAGVDATGADRAVVSVGPISVAGTGSGLIDVGTGGAGVSVGVTLPGVAVTVPGIGVTVPGVGVTLPGVVVTLPPVGVTLPPVGVTVPAVTVPPVTLPPVGVTLPVTVPPVAVPLPPVTVPPVTLPPVTVPPVTVPPVPPIVPL